MFFPKRQLPQRDAARRGGAGAEEQPLESFGTWSWWGIDRDLATIKILVGG